MRWAALAGLLALSACAGAAPPATTYSGIYRTGFETQAFWPATGGGPYWVEGETRAMKDLDAAVGKHNGGSPWGGVRVEVRGVLSPPGKFGHLSAYERKLRVKKVVRTGPADDGAGPRG